MVVDRAARDRILAILEHRGPPHRLAVGAARYLEVRAEFDLAGQDIARLMLAADDRHAEIAGDGGVDAGYRLPAGRSRCAPARPVRHVHLLAMPRYEHAETGCR